jgi:hypothetical protein
LIARGEAHFDLDELSKAQDDFSAALERGRQNVKIRAVCTLHLTRTFLKQELLAEANKLWAAWQGLKDKVQHQLIHALAEEVGEELQSRMKDFTILRSEENLDPKYHVRALRAFLARQAGVRYKSIAKRQEALGGISRSTYHNWIKGKDDPPAGDS